MLWLPATAGVVALGYAWPKLVRQLYETPTHEDELLFARTDDGWSIALSRYRPRGKRRAHPVVIVPGMGSTRRTFDLDEGPSLARHFAERGYDTYVVELRGHGQSEHADFSYHSFSWTFDDYLTHDLPAALTLIRENQQRSDGGGQNRVHQEHQVHYIGHSMGGLIGYCLAPSESFRTLTVIGSSLDYSTSDSDFHVIAKLLPLAPIIPGIPFGWLGSFSAPLAAHDSPIDRFNIWDTNIDHARYRRLMAVGFDAEPIAVFRQLASAVVGSGLTSRDGRVDFSSRLATMTTPLLCMAGDRDRQCPFVAAERTFARVGGSDKTLAKLGPDCGQADHYGHIDMVMGLRAPTETWPVLDAFLDARD